MTTTARNRFCGFRLRLPSAKGAKLQMAQAPTLTLVARQQVAGSLAQPCPPSLFVAASNDARDVAQQRLYSTTVDTYLTRVCAAIGQAHDAWRSQARLVQVVINGAWATGGTLLGSGLAAVIAQRAPRENAWQRSRTDAIAAAVGSCWEEWQRSISVCRLAWYPTFMCLPMSIAPPTPNVPSPLITLQQNPVPLSVAQLKSQMMARYRGDNEWPNELFEAVACGLETAARLWAPLQMVTNVMGSGPVPTFAPPYVPVGPVMNGTGSQVAGAWMA